MAMDVFDSLRVILAMILDGGGDFRSTVRDFHRRQLLSVRGRWFLTAVANFLSLGPREAEIAPPATRHGCF